MKGKKKNDLNQFQLSTLHSLFSLITFWWYGFSILANGIDISEGIPREIEWLPLLTSFMWSLSNSFSYSLDRPTALNFATFSSWNQRSALNSDTAKVCKKSHFKNLLVPVPRGHTFLYGTYIMPAPDSRLLAFGVRFISTCTFAKWEFATLTLYAFRIGAFVVVQSKMIHSGI